MMRWKRWWPDQNEDLPVDVLPCSNGEFYPRPPTADEIAIMDLQNREIERVRQKYGMSRREFVRTAAAMAIGVWAIEQVNMKRAFGHNTATTDACDLEWVGEKAMGLGTLDNLPGEFIFDIQSHHVESDGMWRVTNPVFEAFFAGVWSQAGPVTGRAPGVYMGGDGQYHLRGAGAGEVDPIENLSRYHYLKELFLDSATTMTVLSAVPAAPDITQPLPIDRAALTVQMVEELSGTQRTVMHAFVMPNRGSAGSTASAAGKEPVYMQREFEIMEERAIRYGSFLRGWKTYPAWGDVPYSSGWFFDDLLVGQRFIDQVRTLSQKYKTPPNIATHKGFALPGFDQRGASPRDIGIAASRNPDVNFIVYHSGYDGDSQNFYPGDDKVNSADRTVNSLVKSLRENSWDATAFGAIPGSKTRVLKAANVPNVYAEIGSTWRSVMGNLVQRAHLLGKLITYVGPKRIAWGTDSLWFGSPQSEIVQLRATQYKAGAPDQEIWDSYGLPYAIDGDYDDVGVDTRDYTNYTPSSPNAGVVAGWPTDGKPHPERSIRNAIFGRNAARVYIRESIADEHALDRQIHAIKCDDVQKIRDGYILNQMTPKEQAPLASNTLIGPRTKGELVKMRADQPWGP